MEVQSALYYGSIIFETKQPGCRVVAAKNEIEEKGHTHCEYVYDHEVNHGRKGQPKRIEYFRDCFPKSLKCGVE